MDVFMWQRQSRHIVMISSCVKLEDQLMNVTEKIELLAEEVTKEQLVRLPPYSSPRFETAGNDTVVGLDDDIVAIKHRLCGQSSNLQVIPIIGMGGIGKSTLARTVYEDRLMTKEFDTCAWVVVSQDYSPHKFRKILLGSITSSAGREQMYRDEMDEYNNALEVLENLKGSRYLVVIDDVWSTHVWDDVRSMFPDDNNGSRIILTIRKLDVACYPDPNSSFHEMQFMKDSQSWDILKQKASCPIGSEGVGWEIVRRCRGLPLVVVLVAGVLSAVDATRASWEEVARHVNFNVNKASEDSNVKRSLEDILSLCYMSLPHHLRLCFLYMGGYPKNESIHASTLIKLWVAEGFLKHVSGRLEEEEAGEYLESLVTRNLVMVSSKKINGKIKSCSLHHLVRDFCISKAEQEQFLHVVDGRDRPQHFTFARRRISLLHSNIEDVWGPEIRTILCFKPLNSTPSWQLFLQSCRLLKVLFASNTEELFQRSYKISSAISNFGNLQTLIVLPPAFHRGQRNRNLRPYEGKTSSLALKIWRMQQLRHLILHSPFELPHPLHASYPLKNLQTLLHVKNLVWDVEMVQMIPNVKKLGLVYTDNHRDYHLHHLMDLLQLEKLQVTRKSYVHSYMGEQFITTLPMTLKKLTLVGGGIVPEGGFMAVVGSLPNLQVLKLLDNACYGGIFVTRDGEFPELKLLVIDNSCVEDWITGSNPLPRLEKLVIRSCRFLRKVPEGIGEISSLESIEVAGYCRSTLQESLEQIKEELERCGNETLQVRTIDSK